MLASDLFVSVLGRLQLNPYITNGLSNHYHLAEATFIFGDIRTGVILDFYSLFR